MVYAGPSDPLEHILRPPSLKATQATSPFRRWGNFWSNDAEKPLHKMRPYTKKEKFYNEKKSLYYKNFDMYPMHGAGLRWGGKRIFEYTISVAPRMLFILIFIGTFHTIFYPIIRDGYEVYLNVMADLSIHGPTLFHKFKLILQYLAVASQQEDTLPNYANWIKSRINWLPSLLLFVVWFTWSRLWTIEETVNISQPEVPTEIVRKERKPHDRAMHMTKDDFKKSKFFKAHCYQHNIKECYHCYCTLAMADYFHRNRDIPHIWESNLVIQRKHRKLKQMEQKAGVPEKAKRHHDFDVIDQMKLVFLGEETRTDTTYDLRMNAVREDTVIANYPNFKFYRTHGNAKRAKKELNDAGKLKVPPVIRKRDGTESEHHKELMKDWYTVRAERWRAWYQIDEDRKDNFRFMERIRAETEPSDCEDPETVMDEWRKSKRYKRPRILRDIAPTKGIRAVRDLERPLYLGRRSMSASRADRLRDTLADQLATRPYPRVPAIDRNPDTVHGRMLNERDRNLDRNDATLRHVMVKNLKPMDKKVYGQPSTKLFDEEEEHPRIAEFLPADFARDGLPKPKNTPKDPPLSKTQMKNRKRRERSKVIKKGMTEAEASAAWAAYLVARDADELRTEEDVARRKEEQQLEIDRMDELLETIRDKMEILHYKHMRERAEILAQPIGPDRTQLLAEKEQCIRDLKISMADPILQKKMRMEMRQEDEENEQKWLKGELEVRPVYGTFVEEVEKRVKKKALKKQQQNKNKRVLNRHDDEDFAEERRRFKDKKSMNAFDREVDRLNAPGNEWMMKFSRPRKI